MKSQIIRAIKNFDIPKLTALLDDERSYMDVSKSLFLEKLEKKFEIARNAVCYSFDDVFFGICGSCNKGCEGITFLSNSGFYLDLYIEEEDQTVTDMYVCNQLSNFSTLNKEIDLGFNFKVDEEVKFKPDKKYLYLEWQYKKMIQEMEQFKPELRLDDFISWYNKFAQARGLIQSIGFFRSMEYKLYDNFYSLTADLNQILELKAKEFHAVDALIDYHQAETERERLIWFFRNRTDSISFTFFMFHKTLIRNHILSLKSKSMKFTIDIRGHEYVADYFGNLHNFNKEILEKYMPLPEHFEQSPTGSISGSIENLLRLHGVHLDVVEKYGRK